MTVSPTSPSPVEPTGSPAPGPAADRRSGPRISDQVEMGERPAPRIAKRYTRPAAEGTPIVDGEATEEIAEELWEELAELFYQEQRYDDTAERRSPTEAREESADSPQGRRTPPPQEGRPLRKAPSIDGWYLSG